MGIKFITSEISKEEALRKRYPLRNRKAESQTANLVAKASNSFNNTTVNKRYQKSNMQSKIPISTWRKYSKETSNTREYPKKPFRPAKPNFLFSKGNSNGYGERIADNNDAITDDPQ